MRYSQESKVKGLYEERSRLAVRIEAALAVATSLRDRQSSRLRFSPRGLEPTLGTVFTRANGQRLYIFDKAPTVFSNRELQVA